MILIALGANQPSFAGTPAKTLHAALAALQAHGVEVDAVSRMFASPAWPDPADPPFVNAAALIRTALDPAALLDLLHRIEAQFGRERRTANAPRTLDLDIIDFDGLMASLPDGPLLPHPRAHERAFVLAPLLDVAPGWVHPVSGLGAASLLAAVEAAGQTAVPLP